MIESYGDLQDPKPIGSEGGGSDDSCSVDGASEALPDLLKLGTNYDTCQRLRLNGRPIVMSAQGKWAVLVSRRQFDSEISARNHVQLSELYKEALQKLITAAQVTLSVEPALLVAAQSAAGGGGGGAVSREAPSPGDHLSLSLQGGGGATERRATPAARCSELAKLHVYVVGDGVEEVRTVLYCTPLLLLGRCRVGLTGWRDLLIC